jgi:hypothetical protein
MTMRVGVALGRYATHITSALSQRIGIEAETVSPEVDAQEYDLFIAVDDEPVPHGKEVRRYIIDRRVRATEWTVVATRCLLAAAVEKGNQTPIAVPLPVEGPKLAQSPRTGVALLEGNHQPQIRETFISTGLEIFEIDNPRVGIVVDLSASEGRLEPLRKAMSEEKVVVAMSSNTTASDVIRHNSNGYLVSQLLQIRPVIEELLTNDNERYRLGFEARKSVAAANWQRVTRALLLDGRTGIPHLEEFGPRSARKRWTERLGHAHRWESARYSNNQLVLLDECVDLRGLGQLRKMNIERTVNSGDL